MVNALSTICNKQYSTKIVTVQGVGEMVDRAGNIHVDWRVFTVAKICYTC